MSPTGAALTSRRPCRPIRGAIRTSTAFPARETHDERQQVRAGILVAIHRGEPFSQAVAGFPQYFSALYVATIKASERTGDVKEALGRYIAYQEEFDKVRKKIVSATI